MLTIIHLFADAVQILHVNTEVCTNVLPFAQVAMWHYCDG